VLKTSNRNTVIFAQRAVFPDAYHIFRAFTFLIQTLPPKPTIPMNVRNCLVDHLRCTWFQTNFQHRSANEACTILAPELALSSSCFEVVTFGLTKRLHLLAENASAAQRSAIYSLLWISVVHPATPAYSSQLQALHFFSRGA
jgi:hypothetical protein